MSVMRTVVRRPTTLLIVFILLIGLGVYAAIDLTIDLFPEINPLSYLREQAEEFAQVGGEGA